MTKIPSNYTPIETILINKFECTIPAPLHSAQIEAITQALTAEREAGAKDERARITKNLSELRQTTLNGEVFISEESIKGEVDNWSKYKIVTPPTK